ncbi:uncharacterized protein NECHADRAFT_79991 [Fusarium vanettenii 77-13-4]|uniref:FAD/NAD(P)-binding domain-containing protein n=1 Tax=Fusarium vanettenii (strain ATCC MYA-4622 / CBS 123669 / FGSC 9596 / NRRL 45880 / 77-13-4) TaxID=660122 RepID=C7Z0S4_FUSV7|nr:uncharacterized protein NECHADRAFT_79991 [Fusarium vanettenii 77-13-4]EEU42250.1 hypothetical protein NECHADRAFT_79991 [Fusarium vanettenii 77-13-4]
MPSYVENNSLDAIIVGAGFGGCYLLKNMRKQGFKVRVLEEGLGVGGVWWHNRYPGARSDTPVPLYEFSDPDIWNNWEWSEEYPGQPEIKRYFEFVDRQWDLSRDITFGVKVTDASFDPERDEWTVKTNTGLSLTARFFLPAMGFASKIFTPRLKGLENFQGFTCHTAKWPEEPVDFKGKRVGVIGTGATGVQVIQELGPKVKELVVFQRSPNCALPMRQKPWGNQDKTAYPSLYKQMKTTSGGFLFDKVQRRAMDDTPEQRAALYEELWQQGGFAVTLGSYVDLMTDLESSQAIYEFWRDKVRKRILKNDPELLEHLAPMKPPFPFGTKRPSLEQKFYEVFNQDNVKLVGLKKNPIDEVLPHGVRLADGTVLELDALILATGFDAVTGSFSRVNIKGLKNKVLNQEWGTGSRTVLGLATSGFPNMLYMYGPQSPAAWSVGPVISEIQSDWIIRTLCYMRQHRFSRIEPRPAAEKEWAHVTNEECNKTLLPLNETTWYMGGNVPGKPREALNYMGGLPAYQKALDECHTNGFSSFHLQ